MRFVVDQIKDRHPIADRRQQTGAVIVVDKVSSPIDSAQKI